MNPSLAMQASITIKEKTVSCNKGGSLRGFPDGFLHVQLQQIRAGTGAAGACAVSYWRNSQVWFPRSTETRLPAPRWWPEMVTMVPPDSGPRLGLRKLTAGVCREERTAQGPAAATELLWGL